MGKRVVPAPPPPKIRGMQDRSPDERRALGRKGGLASGGRPWSLEQARANGKKGGLARGAKARAAKP
jgi:general stress protein YciG